MRTARKPRRAVMPLMILALWFGRPAWAGAGAHGLQRLVDFHIGPQSLAAALIEFSQQSGMQVITPAAAVAHRATRGVHGALTVAAALGKLLRGTGLGFHLAAADTIGIDASGRYAAASRARGQRSPAHPPPPAAPASTVASPATIPPAAAPIMRQVVVSGSRLLTRRTRITPVPVDSIVDAAFLRAHGYTNVADALNVLPELQGSITPFGAQNDFGVGFNYIDLYNLGSSRTLELVNGLRFVSDNPTSIFANSGGTQLDLNALPGIFLDRIDIVPATGAAIYGADAVSGVVNIRMKRRFTGARLVANLLNSAGWDAGGYDLEGAVGRDFLHRRLNLALAAEFDQTTAVSERQRPWTALQQGFVPNPAYTGPGGGVPAQIVADNLRLYGITNGGLPYRIDGRSLIDLPGTATPAQFAGNGNLVPFATGTVYSPTQASGGDSLDLAPMTPLLTPNERLLLYGIGSYHFPGRVRLETAVAFDYVGSRLADNQPNYAYTAFGLSPAYEEPLPGAAWLISPQNAFLDPQARNVLAAAGVTDFYLSRSNYDATPSPIFSFVRTLNINTTLRGRFRWLRRRFHWDLSYSHGQAYSSFSQYGFVYGNPAYHVPDLLGYALDSIIGPDGKPECRVTAQNPASRNPYVRDCVPFDPFGFGNNSRAALDYVTANFGDTALNWQDDLEANLQAPVARLPAGPLRAAIGAESRYEYGSFHPSTASREGIGYSVPIAATHGRFTTHEVYGEIRVPVLGGRASRSWVRQLTLDGAFRRVDSSLAGYSNAWNFGVVYAPTADVAVRLSRARTYREPSLQEAYSPQTAAFDSGLDPCQASNLASGPDPAARQRNCAAAFAALGANLRHFTSSSVETLTIPVQSGGNTALADEIAHSMDLGLVLTPRRLPGLTASADYIQILIRQAIEYAGVGLLMEQCYDAPVYPTATCGDFTRQPGTGQVVGARETFINAGFNHLRLVQYRLDYRRRLGALPWLGRFDDPGTIDVDADVLDMRENNSSVSGKGFDVIESAGTIGVPRWSFVSDIGYGWRGWSFHWLTLYSSRSYFDLTYTPANLRPLSIPSSTIHDFDVLYRFGRHYQLGLHIENVFDKAPPQPWVYGADSLGRMFELSVRARLD